MAKDGNGKSGQAGQKTTGVVQRQRGGGARSVAELLPEVGGMAFRRFGFLHGALVGRWRDVVGPVYARWSLPQSIRFPRGARTGGTLTVLVEGPFSLQLQHVSPQIVERANRILGSGMIQRVKLVQGEVPAPAERPERGQAPTAAPATNLVGIRDSGLRAALEALADGLQSSVPSRLPQIR